MRCCKERLDGKLVLLLRLRRRLAEYGARGGGGLRTLGADTVLYGGSRALAAAFALLTFPVVSRILTPEDLGQFAIVQTLTLLLVPLASIGQDMSVMKFLSRTQEERNDADVNVTSLAIQLLGILASVLLACAIAAAFGAQTTRVLEWDLFVVALVGVPAGVLFSSVLNLSKFRFMRGTFLGISVLQVVLYTLFLTASVIILRYGVYGYALSTAGALMAASLVGLYLLRGQFHGGRVSPVLGRALLVFGAPYALVGLLAVLMPLLDRILLGLFASAAEIGVYSVAVRYAGVVEMAIIGFKMAWWPFAFSSYSGSGDTGVFGRALCAYATAAGCLVACMYFASDIGVELLAGETYAGAVAFVLPLLLAAFIRGLQVVVGAGIAISGKAFWAPLGSLMGILAGVAVALALWPAVGTVAAAWGVAAGESMNFLVTAIVSRRLLAVRWGWGRTAILVGLLLAYLGLVDPTFTPLGLAEILLFLLVYCFVGWRVLKNSGVSSGSLR